MKIKKDESGLGAIEVLLVLVIVIAIAGTGYYVYKAKKDTSNTYNMSANTSTTTNSSVKPKATSEVTQKYLTITEFGIKFMTPSQDSDLTYTYSNKIATLHSASLQKFINQNDPECYMTDANTPADWAGNIEVFTPNPLLGGSPTVTIKGVGYTYSGYQNSCNPDTTNYQKVNTYISSSQTAIIDALTKAVSSN